MAKTSSVKEQDEAINPPDGSYPHIDNILVQQAVEVDINSLKPYQKNPRVGNLPAIRESLRKNGQFRPIIVRKETREIIGGNHTWKAAKAEGWTKISAVFLDVSDEQAKRIVLADNRTNDLATYDSSILQDILQSLPDPSVGTGYDDESVKSLLGAINEANEESAKAIIDNVVRPPLTITPLEDGEISAEIDNSIGGPPPASGESGPVYTKTEDDPEDNEDLRDELGELQGILQLREDMRFGGNNYYDFPDLVPSGLLEKLPDPIDTWGGHDATPDDGKTTWVWNYGVASKKNLPFDRSILCFYTYDTYFESFWEQPAFMTAKVMNAGIKTVVVPDFSYYSETGVATWVFNHFRAQWLGRYFQEVGLKVIPRIQYAIDKKDSHSLDFNCMGIPVGSPVVAKSSHNANTPEEFDLEVYGLIKSMEKVQPETLLLYGGNPAKRVMEAADLVGKGLVKEVVHIYNYAHKRRGVVFDKKEGMASKAYKAQKAKEKARLKADPHAEAEPEETPEESAEETL